VIGELEAQHTWEHGGFVMNNLAAYPQIKLEEIPGLISTGDFDPEAFPATGRRGEVAVRADREGKTVSYLGRMIGRDRDELAAIRSAWISAFDTTDEWRMLVTGRPGGPEIEHRYFYARPLAASAESRQEHGPNRTRSRGWERPASVDLRLSDPRYYHADENGDPVVVTQTDDTLAEMSGLAVPFTPPGQMASGEGFQIAVANAGQADTDGVFTLTGPWRNPLLSNETLGYFLKFKDLDLDTDEQLIVDFKARRAQRANGANMNMKIRPGSTWWDPNVVCFASGAQTIRGRGYAIGAGASMSLTYTPADLA
jgi:hypothetical protein